MTKKRASCRILANRLSMVKVSCRLNTFFIFDVSKISNCNMQRILLQRSFFLLVLSNIHISLFSLSYPFPIVAPIYTYMYFCLERANNSNVNRTSKKHKSDDQSFDDESSVNLQPALQSTSKATELPKNHENNANDSFDAKLGKLYKMVAKVYTLQKRSSRSDQV
jgi:hypothetical protein